MSKMSDMATTIEELRNAAVLITDAVNWFVESFSEASHAGKHQKKETALTLEYVRAILAEKSRQGQTAEIRSLLQKYGATKLSQIDPAHYKALIAEVEALTNGQ